MSDARPCGRPGEEGIALFLVLWVLIFLSVIVGEFCYTMRTELNIARNFKEETQAYYIARAGVHEGLKRVIENERRPPDLARIMEEEQAAGEWTDARLLRINVRLPVEPFGEGGYELFIGNESGKININQADESTLMMLFSGFGLDDDQKSVIVDSILDWRDADDMHRLNGAESDYYKSLPQPYEAKNGPFDSVQELLLVKGITPELFYGGLKDLVTVYPLADNPQTIPGRRQAPSVGGNKVNINAASPQMLLALPMMTEDLVRKVLAFRQERDFLAESEVVDVLGADVANAVMPYITVGLNPYYTITSTGLLPGSKVRRTVEMMVEVDPRYPKGYRVVRWMDVSDEKR